MSNEVVATSASVACSLSRRASQCGEQAETAFVVTVFVVTAYRRRVRLDRLNLTVIPDPRLNRLICLGNTFELDEVEQVLKVLDMPEGPTNIEVTGTPHLIYVKHLAADVVATLVQSTFADRITGGAQGQQQQQQQPNPADILRALRGGRGGGGQEDSRGELPKMTVTVDTTSNSLIVKAPDALYREIKQFVEMIDQPNEIGPETVEVLTSVANPQLVQEALTKLLGPKATAGSTSSTTNNQGGQQGAPQGMEEIQRRMEMFRQLQGQMGGGRNDGGRGGRGGRGGGGQGGQGGFFGGGQGNPFGGGGFGGQGFGGQGFGGQGGGGNNQGRGQGGGGRGR